MIYINIYPKMKCFLGKIYRIDISRIKFTLKTKLNAKNTIKAINTYAIFVVTQVHIWDNKIKKNRDK